MPVFGALSAFCLTASAADPSFNAVVEQSGAPATSEGYVLGETVTANTNTVKTGAVIPAVLLGLLVVASAVIFVLYRRKKAE